MSRLSRRTFLGTVGGAAVAAPLATLPGCRTGGPEEGGTVASGRSGSAPDLSPAPGSRLVEHTLTTEQLERTFQAGTPDEVRTRLRAYNGQIPGPLLEIRPGDHLRVTLQNRLPPYDSTGWTGDHNVPHALDTTNLHLHGLSVITHLFEPVGTSDPTAQMIAVGPGEDYVYDIPIPDDQPDGLYWYHPHHHGSTAVQAVTGMAGGIVVRGPVDEVPEIAAAAEHFLVFNDLGLFPSEDGSGVYEYSPVQNSVWQTLAGASGPQVTIWDPETETMVPAPDLNGGFSTGDYRLRYYLVNGEPFFREVHRDPSDPAPPTPPGCNAASPPSPQAVPIGTQLDVPRITMRPGEVARFRLLNAMSDDVMPIAVEGHDLHLIELDGVNLLAPRTIPEVPITGLYPNQQLLLAPANRASFLLQASEPGVYRVQQLGQCAQFLYSEARVLAEIEVTGEPMDPPMALPTELPTPTREYPLITPDEVDRVRNVTFSMAFPGTLNPIVGLDFMINNAVYDERSVQAVVDLGSVEEWHLTVPDAMEGGSEGHPFHIHVNSFEVISITNLSTNETTMLPPGTIQDTIWVPADHTVVIRSTFKQWTGKAVYHCHILPHEDTGMMQNFLILPAGSGH